MVQWIGGVFSCQQREVNSSIFHKRSKAGYQKQKEKVHDKKMPNVTECNYY